MKKRRNKKMWIMIAIPAVSLLGVLYLFTPFGFFGVRPQGEYQMNLIVNGHTMTATMENNTSAWALHRMLEHGPKTVSMRDYGGMEKVGMLWKGLPTNNEDISTQPGDLILFMGSSFVVYYNTNHWNFTRLGHINDVSQAELKVILGNGSVTITLSLPEE